MIKIIAEKYGEIHQLIEDIVMLLRMKDEEKLAAGTKKIDC